MIALSDFLSTSTWERVAILNADTYSVIFESASPMSVSVHESKRATKFAVEDGTERSDHVVQDLTEIQIEFLLADDTRNAFENLRQAYLQNTLMIVQTKVGSYENMLITDLPHDEKPELGTAVNVPIRMQEWVEVKPEYGELPPKKVANKNQSSTVKRGQQQTTEAPPAQKEKSTIYKVYEAGAGIFNR